MDLKQALRQIQQGQQKAVEKIIPKQDPKIVRLEFLKKLNEISLENSYGKRGFIIDKENEKVIELLCQHLNREEEFEKHGSLNKGIWLYGNFGSGKTIIMQTYVEIKRRLGEKVGFVACNDLNVSFMEVDNYNGKQKRYDGIKKFTDKRSEIEWVFDDLGEEEITINDYGNKISIMAYVLGERYKNKKLTHITTNLDTDEVADDYGGRIESRSMEMFNMIKLGATKSSIDYRKK